MMAENLLEMTGVSKHFGGIAALTDVSLTIQRGEIYALIGPNGAGKTSLFNVITGIYTPDSGTIIFDGKTVTGKKPHQMARVGVARTFQNIRLFHSMTALENVMVGRHCCTSTGVIGAIFHSPKAKIEELAIKNRARELLDYVGIAHHINTVARHLSYGDQRRLEIARALATEPQLLALDEPAAGMNHTETNSLEILFRKIRADGVTLLLIEHDVKLIMGLCDRLTVLNFGRKIAEGQPDFVRNNSEVIEAYLGVSVP
jgi:branched-chain amino acid transport system ATP-binding protein